MQTYRNNSNSQYNYIIHMQMMNTCHYARVHSEQYQFTNDQYEPRMKMMNYQTQHLCFHQYA